MDYNPYNIRISFLKKGIFPVSINPTTIFMNLLETPKSVHTRRVLDVDEVIAYLANATFEDLVVLDVDDTLITPKDQCLRASCRDRRMHHLALQVRSDRTWNLYSRWLDGSEQELISEELLKAVRSLQEAGVNVVALTAMGPTTGACGIIPSMADKRCEELKKLGYDFSQSFRGSRLTLQEKKGVTPLFKDGIIYNYPYKKGLVLENFLSVIPFKPRHVFFLDDSPDCTADVAQALIRLQIGYTCINYLDKKLTIDKSRPDITGYQVQYFLKHQVWLSDAQADKLLDKEADLD